MTKKERLEALISHYSDGKPTRFAKHIGIAPSTISTWLARDTFDYDLLIAKCESVSPEWLLTGKGPMLKSEEQPLPEPQKTSSRRKGFPLIPMETIACFPAIDYDRVSFDDCQHYSIPEFEAKGASFLIRVSGDSMIPLSTAMETSSLAAKSPRSISSSGAGSMSSTPARTCSSSTSRSAKRTTTASSVSQKTSTTSPFPSPRTTSAL